MENKNIVNYAVYIFMIGLLLGFTPTSSGCKCPGLEHPQWLFCKSDIVIKAFVTNITTVYSEVIKTRPIGNFVHVHIYQKFKGERKFKDVDHTRIYTPLGCEIKPRIGKKYIMMGLIVDNAMTMTRCNFIQPSHKVSSIQRLGLKKLYKKNCRCIADIGTNNKNRPNPKDRYFKGCTTRDKSTFDIDCYINHAICVERSDRKCTWRGKFRKRKNRKNA